MLSFWDIFKSYYLRHYHKLIINLSSSFKKFLDNKINLRYNGKAIVKIGELCNLTKLHKSFKLQKLYLNLWYKNSSLRRREDG